MQVCRDAAHRIAEEPAELCSESACSQGCSSNERRLRSAAALQDGARPQLWGEVLRKLGEGTALPSAPGDLLRLPGDTPQELG